MAFPREKLSLRQKGCIAVAVILMISGLFQVALGTYNSMHPRASKCTKSRSVVIGAYLIVAGIAGIIGYFPRRARNHAKQVPMYGRRNTGSRAAVVLFVVVCSLVAVLVVVDSHGLFCAIKAHSVAKDDDDAVFAVLGLVEVTVMHISHLLCAVCVGIACPDLLFKGLSISPSSSVDSSTKFEKSQNHSLKHKTSKQALHLPEARTHVQEVPGTGEKVTVVSLPLADGIVYAVPEEQYVIRRGEATYMAPTGNSKLAAFFPTYTRILAE